LNKIELDADGFLFLANGRLNMERELSLAAEFYIPEELSSAMSSSVQELTYLLDANGRIFIPLQSYTGDIKDFVIYPDVEYLTKQIIGNKGKDELKKALFKALDIETTSNTENTQDGQNNQIEENDNSPEKVLIEDVLDAIF